MLSCGCRISLEDYQEMISGSFRDFFEKECPSSLVRETEAAGYAPGLWKRLVGMGAVSMALPAEAGGDGSSLVDLTLVAEEAGSVMAPVPLIAHVVARGCWPGWGRRRSCGGCADGGPGLHSGAGAGAGRGAAAGAGGVDFG